MKTVRKRNKAMQRSLKMLTGKGRAKVGLPKGSDSLELTKGISNEYGTFTKSGEVKIPERPFMRNSFSSNSVKLSLKDIIVHDTPLLMKGMLSVDQAVDRLALEMVAQIQLEIRELKKPENSQATIDRKGSANPLIDQGDLRRAIRHEKI